MHNLNSTTFKMPDTFREARLKTIKEEESSFLETSRQSRAIVMDSSQDYRNPSAEFGKEEDELRLLADQVDEDGVKKLILTHSSHHGRADKTLHS